MHSPTDSLFFGLGDVVTHRARDNSHAASSSHFSCNCTCQVAVVTRSVLRQNEAVHSCACGARRRHVLPCNSLCGTIVGVGSAVDARAFRINQRVVIEPWTFCGGCYYCDRGQTNLCESGCVYFGGLQQYITVDHRMVNPDPSFANTCPLSRPHSGHMSHMTHGTHTHAHTYTRHSLTRIHTCTHTPCLTHIHGRAGIVFPF